MKLFPTRSTGFAILLAALLTRCPAAEAQTLKAQPLIGLKGEVASLILAGRPGGAFSLSSVALPVIEQPGRAEIWLEIHGAELLAAADLDPVPAESLNLEVYAYAIDNQGQVPAYLASTFAVDLDPWGEVVNAAGLRYSGHLEGLEPGTYRLRVLVRLLGDPGRYALDELLLSIPGTANQGRALAFSVPTATGPWLAIESGNAQAETTTLPAALPLLYSGRSNTLEVLTGAADNEATADVASDRAVARLLGATDQDPTVVNETTLAWTGSNTTHEGGRRRTAELTLPAMAAGAYRLEIELTGGGVTPRRKVFVVAGELAEQADTWPAVQRLAGTVSSSSGLSSSEPSTLQPLPDASDDKPQRLRLGRAYRKILELLASGATEQAAEALTQLEQEAAHRHGSPWGPLAQQQLRVQQRLARRQPESLPPIILLHLDQHARHARARRFAFAAANRATIVELTRLYAASSTSEQAPALAARALAGLGIYLQAASLWQPGEELLEEALLLDPDNPSARLQLAIFHEVYGRYPLTVNHLQALAANRTDLEPRVRLAINLRRTQKPEEAEQLLRGVIGELGHDADPYLSLAYQELAKLYLDSDRATNAASLLEAAVSRLPDSPRLRLQLAFVYERLGQSAESRARLAALGPSATTPSPRFLYNRGWQRKVSRPRRELERGARARLGALAVALDGAGR